MRKERVTSLNLLEEQFTQEDTNPQTTPFIWEMPVIPKEWLLRMASDADGLVRLEIAQRLAPHLLSRLRYDPDWRVRYEVASRVSVGEIADLVDDSDGFVQEMARARLTGRHERSRDVPI